MQRLEKLSDTLNQYLLWVYVGVSLGTLFIGAWHCHPNIEELSICEEPRDLGVFAGALHMLVHFDGRYFANILHGLNPLAFNWLAGYKLMPILAVTILILALFFLLRPCVAKSEQQTLLLIVVTFLMLQFQISPSLPYQLFWMASSFIYLWSWTFTMLWMGFYYRYLHTASSFFQVLYLLLTAIFLTFSIGISELFLVLNVLLLASIFVWRWFKKNKAIETSFLVLWGLACILFFVLSPGISERAKEFRHADAPIISIPVIVIGIKQNLLFAQRIFFHPLLLLATIVLFPLFHSIPFFQRKLRFPFSVFLALLFLVIAFAMTCAYYIPTQINTGFPTRIFTATGLLVASAAILVYISMFRYIHSIVNQQKWYAKVKAIMPVCTVGLIVGTFTLNVNNNFWSIQQDYKNGHLTTFDNAMCLRYTTLSRVSADADDCYKTAIIVPIPNFPSSICFGNDLLPNRTYAFDNEAWETYFGIDEVMLQGDTVRKPKNTITND